MQVWKINGGSIAITKNGNFVYTNAFGYADKRKSEPTQTKHLFRIASVSKSITSIAIMKMMEEGRLKLTDTVFGSNRILDNSYYLSSVSDKRILNITVNDLLEHTSGWDRAVPVDGFTHSDPAFFPLHVCEVLKAPNPVGDSTLIKFALLKGLNDAPGKHYAYSNIGYLILGKVIEKLSGMNYETYLMKTIFNPLGITDISLGNNLSSDKKENEVEYSGEALSFSCYGGGALVESQYGGFNVEAMNAHGGWIASAESLAKLLLAVDGFSTSPDLLSPATINSMNNPGSLQPGYAKGWFVNRLNNRWHTGSMDGTSSFVCITGDGYTWTFLFNSRSDNSPAFWKAFDRLPRQCINALPKSNSYVHAAD